MTIKYRSKALKMALRDVLERAYAQAATGKGAQRHGQNRPFQQQPMQTISGLIGSSDGLAYQAVKKIQESQRMERDAAISELLGAINYLAGAIIYKESRSCPPATSCFTATAI